MSPAGHGEWSQPESYATMGSAPDDDFSNFLELDGIDLNFAPLDANALNAENGTSQSDRGGAQTYGKSPFPQQGQYPGGRIDGNDEHQQWLQRGQMTPSSYPERLDTSGFDAYRQQEGSVPWLPEQNFQQHYSVPPTPNSSEMYPAHYVQQQQLQQSQRYQQYRKDEGTAAFTPHESPHFVGSEGSFSIPEFQDAGSFNLALLTSPAMNPQPGSGHGSVYRQPHTAESSVVGSPATLELDDGNLSSSFNDRPRKTRKKAPSVKSTPNSTGQKPLGSTGYRQRKGSVSARSHPRDGPDPSTKGTDFGPSSKNRSENVASERNDSTSTSASPQPLHEIQMAPPPKPSSVKSTPTLRPQSSSNQDGFPPATPASLMRLPHQVRPGASGTVSPATNAEQLHGPMEELTLPEAAAPGASISAHSAHGQTRSVQSTPVLHSNPSSTGPSAIASPIRSSNGSAKNSQGRNSRKRNSTSSTLVSPALRPRISPSIKPLLPEGSQHNISDETHALLLASKSNYQNLLEGNHLPGVNYPSELSTNLTSKRTSHKIAEQGRRNRINTALQEMQTLLPASPSTTGVTCGTSPNIAEGNGSADDEAQLSSKTPTTPAQAANSKAATVELAIDYIKTLNSRLADKETENEKLKQEMAALKAKFDE